MNVLCDTYGSIHVDEGFLDFNDILFYSGTVSGNGTLDLTDATLVGFPGANISPGDSPGTFTLLGNYLNYELNMEIAEIEGAVLKDSLSVSGNVNLNGSTLNIQSSGTLPEGIFPLISFAGNPGNTQFSTVNFPPLCGDCSLVYTENDISLSNAQACIPNLVLENMVLGSGTYHSQGDLVCNAATMQADGLVIFKSDTGVLLQQDFTMEAGSVFEIVVEGCQ